MIDAANFEPQGKPTPAQVKVIWEGMHANGKAPSVRKTHIEVTKRGFDVSLSTVGRYILDGFRDVLLPGATKPVDEKIRATENAKKKALKAATTLKRMPGTEDGSADTERAPMSGVAAAVAPPIEAELAALRIKFMDEMLLKDEAEIAAYESKIRRIYNIMLMRESIAIADKLATIPKDNSMMVVAQAEGIAKTTVMMADPTKPGPHRFDPNNPRVIEHQDAPPDPLAASITAFLHKEGMAAA